MNVEWKVEKVERAEFNVPTCGKIAVWQLCRERQPLRNSHDGLNLTCLDQCHGVRSPGTSSSQGWRKRIVVQSKFDPANLGYFQMKELDRTTEAIVPMNEMWRKLNANMHQYVPLRANMGQHCSLSAVQRKTAFVEQSWWPEFNMFGSMPWCSFPWHKLLPRLAQKNCCTV